jgi:hypothetical protein
MKHLDEYRAGSLARPLVDELQRAVTKPLRVMEVCGSHTMAIFRNGIRTILPAAMELVSGPGCPVCVTSASHMDAFIGMADRPGVRVAIFGDLFRVPGSQGSLAEASSRGAKVEIVYSPMDALELATRNPEELVVFLGVGFETTTPGIAATIFTAKNRGIKNFTVFSTQKTMPAPMDRQQRHQSRKCLPPRRCLGGQPARRKDGGRNFRAGRHGLARPWPHPLERPENSIKICGIRCGNPPRHHPAGGPGAERLPVRQRPQGEKHPQAVPSLCHQVHPGHADRAVHGVERRNLRGLL